MKKSEIEQLERQGCRSSDWSLVEIAGGTDLGGIRNVWFRGPVTIGEGTTIVNVPGGISNVRIGRNVRIENVARIENSADTTFGTGTEIAVLDETGSRPVKIYPGISAQIAALAARMPEYARRHLSPLIDSHIKELKYDFEIGDGAEILDCGPITDVRVWPGAKVEGVASLHNGSIISSHLPEREPAYVGPGVYARNFIIEDGYVSNGTLIQNTYVGQGAILDKGFTSHDSLFFANCSMENGEACAVLAGPYTVSMHKSSLLIGCQTAFMNAGSGTNMSNHMYKHGPLHWGVLERGVKTASNAYLMHGSRIGAFSLVMGSHKTHADTSDFPFSYLFDDDAGHTVVVPGAMLKSYGLKRDEEKWPRRDRRQNRFNHLHDRITYRILNPYTVDMILNSLDIIDSLLTEDSVKESAIDYKGLTMKRSSLEKGREMYRRALCKYLQILSEANAPAADVAPDAAERWVDLAGMIIPASTLRQIMNAGSITEMEKALDRAAESTETYEKAWAEGRMKRRIETDGLSPLRAADFDSLIDQDRKQSLQQIAIENDMLSFL